MITSAALHDGSHMTPVWNYTNITTDTTTTVKDAPGLLRSIVINEPVASSVITVYDSTAASGTIIATITLPATLLNQGPMTWNPGGPVVCGTGITVKTGTGASDITVIYA